MTDPIPDDIRRFIMALPSVPHLEAILLVRSEPGRNWGAAPLSERLFIDGDRAVRILDYLVEVGLCIPHADIPGRYAYRPASDELDGLTARLASFYSRHLIEVTRMIHANTQTSYGQRVQQFADAFRWRKEK